MTSRRPLATALAALLLPLLLLAGWSQAAERTIVPAGELTIFLRQGVILEVDQPLYNVFVADPNIADVMLQSPQRVYIFGKAIGDTTVFLSDETGGVVAGRTVRVTHDIATIGRAIGEMLPAASVQVRSVGRSLVIDGAVDSPVAIDDIRRLARSYVGSDEEVLLRVGLTAANQVNLRVRVAEISRALDDRLGVQWESLFGGGNSVAVGFAGGAGSGATDAFATALQVITGTIDLNVVVDALSAEGLISILAEPNLTAISGESASFLAGGEFPVPVAGQEGDVTIEFKQFGVSLTFTPTLIDGNRISLKVAPEVSEIDFTRAVEVAGVTVPALTTRRASTTVELGSGQSFAIAGLLKSTSSQDVDKLPGLGDLPILGALFRSTAYIQGETELVIIVTPYLVQPVARVADLQLPTDGLAPPNELERLLLGEFQSPAAGDQPTLPSGVKPRLAGGAGFILE
jgi:pilus assembly protein CpaC